MVHSSLLAFFLSAQFAELIHPGACINSVLICVVVLAHK